MRVLVHINNNVKGGDSGNSGTTLINYNGNNKLFLEIHPNQSIWMIKTQLFNLFQIPPARQQLYLKVLDEMNPRETSKAYSKLLHSYRLVKDYRIHEGSELQMVALEKEIPSEFLVPPKKTQSNSMEKLPHFANLSMSSMSNMDNGGGGRIHVLSSKKGEECPALCFAVGKGLYRGISGVVYEIKLYRVDSKGMLIVNTSLNFQIDIIKKDAISVEDRKMPFTYEQRKSDHSLLKLQPIIYGEYSISIKIDDTPICGSPFHCTIIDELNPNLKELAFSNEWIEEVVQLITLMSNKPSTIDKLFSFGIEGLMNLMFYPDPTIQIHIIGIFAKLIEKDKNKERVLKEFGMDFIFKLVSLDSWSNFMELRKLVASSLCILSCYKPFLNRFFKEVGSDVVSLIARSDFIDCPRSCAIFLSRVSEISFELNEYLTSDSIKETLIYLLSVQDNITVNCTLKTISNLSSSFDLKKESNIKLLSSLLEYCKEFQEVSKKVLIFKSFSNFCVNESLCTFLISNGILDLMTPTHDKSGYFGIPMFCQWESNTTNYIVSNNNEINLRRYGYEFNQVFKEETDYVFFLSLTISNMLVSTTSLKIHDHFSRGNGLNLLKQFIICHECSVRSEAFRSFMIISNSPNDQCKKHLIQSGIIPYLVSSLFDSLSVETPFIVNTLANLCKYDPTCVENMGVDDIDKFIELLHQNPASIAKSISYILSHLIKHDKYKQRIVCGGSKLFLQHLVEFVRQGEISILKYISQSDLELTKEIGRGVSGVVKRGKWKGYEIAVKQINEEELGFSEREFHSEATIMSVLRHDNIAHCVGGSDQPGRMYLVCDYYSRGSLYGVITANICPLSNARIVHLALQVAKGMNYLHSLGIIHRDLKSGNLLIDQDWNIRISDFGSSRVVDSRMTKTVGTPIYMAVEVLKGQTDYSLQADVYSFAFVLWECISRQIPYKEYAQIQWISMVLEESFRPPIPDSCLPELRDLITMCWASNPDDRPTFQQIINYLDSLRLKMQEQGIYQILTGGNIDDDSNDIGVSGSNNNESSTAVSLNENKVNIDMSMHPTEELKNLVEFSKDDNQTNSDYDIRSCSTSSSPSNLSAPQSPIGSTSPIGSASTSPVLNNSNIGNRSATQSHDQQPHHVKWERIVPDKPNPNSNSKRLSAFRNKAVPISIKDNNGNNNNNNNNNNGKGMMINNSDTSRKTDTFSSMSSPSSVDLSSGVESSNNRDDSFLSNGSSLSDQNRSVSNSISNSVGGFSLPPPPLAPSFYASMINEKISTSPLISSSIENNTTSSSCDSTNSNINTSNTKYPISKFKSNPSFEALKSKFDNKD